MSTMPKSMRRVVGFLLAGGAQAVSSTISQVHKNTIHRLLRTIMFTKALYCFSNVSKRNSIIWQSYFQF